MNRIAAVVVTFNRKALLIENLRALLAQTRPVDRIFVIDNASSDGTELLLESEGLRTHERIEYTQLTENSGGAGGFRAGFEAAIDAGYDWLWLMDDDAEPRPDALEKLDQHLGTPGVAGLGSLVVKLDGTIDGLHRGWFKPMRGDSITRQVGASDLEGMTTVPIEFVSFVGACIPASSVRAVGMPKQEFFIHADDLEYSLRLRAVGPLLLVPDSVICHKEVQIKAMTAKGNVMMAQRLRVDYDKLWLHFYGYRNLVWLASHGKITAKWSQVALLHARKLLGVLLYDDHKLTRMSFWNAALIDGMRGTFDNAKPKRLLRKA